MIWEHPENQWWDTNGSQSLARIVVEEDQYEDFGILDQHGQPLKFKVKKQSIGFIRFEP